MGLGEKNPAGGEPIKIRGQCLRVTAETTNPIIQVIDRDKKHVRARLLRRAEGAVAEQPDQKTESN